MVGLDDEHHLCSSPAVGDEPQRSEHRPANNQRDKRSVLDLPRSNLSPTAWQRGRPRRPRHRSGFMGGSTSVVVEVGSRRAGVRQVSWGRVHGALDQDIVSTGGHNSGFGRSRRRFRDRAWPQRGRVARSDPTSTSRHPTRCRTCWRGWSARRRQLPAGTEGARRDFRCRDRGAAMASCGTGRPRGTGGHRRAAAAVESRRGLPGDRAKTWRYMDAEVQGA